MSDVHTENWNCKLSIDVVLVQGIPGISEEARAWEELSWLLLAAAFLQVSHWKRC